MKILFLRLSFLCLILLITAPLAAQKIRWLELRKGNRWLSNGKNEKSAALFSELVKRDSTHLLANYGAALSYYYWTPERVKALPYLERCTRHFKKKDTLADVYYLLGDCYLLYGRREEAKKYFLEYERLVNSEGTPLNDKEFQELQKDIACKINSCNGLIPQSMIPVILPGAILKPLPGKVNSPYDEYSSLVSSADSVIFFTSRAPGGGKTSLDKDDYKHFEHIMRSSFGKEGWQEPSLLPNINKKRRHNATDYISSNGKLLYFYRGKKNGSLYMSELTKSSWSKPEPLQGKDLNKKDWKTSLSFRFADNSVMFIVSDRKGGYGGRDIYVSKRQPDGTWGAFENLGPEINTKFDEESPHVGPDGFLYFASTGHNSIGGFDLFMTKPSTGGGWIPAANLGSPVNSTADDIFFHFSSDGQKAYFSSNRLKGEHYDMDIYVLEKEESITTKKDSVTVPVQVTVADTNTNNGTGTGSPSDLTVYFGFEDATLEIEFKARIDQIFASVRLKQETKIELHGYSDNKGSEKFNYELSIQRANAVKAYLESKGIKNTITVTGHGEEDPVQDNKTLEGRIKNRRVEIKFSH